VGYLIEKVISSLWQTATKKKKKSNNNFLQSLSGFWILFGLGILANCPIVPIGFHGVLGELPLRLKTWEKSADKTGIRRIISSDGETLGKFYLDDNRTDCSITKILPKNLVDASGR